MSTIVQRVVPLLGATLLITITAHDGHPATALQGAPRQCQRVTVQQLERAAGRARGELALPVDLTILPDGRELMIQLPATEDTTIYCVGFLEDGVVTGVIAAGPGTGQEAGTTVIRLKVPNLEFGVPQQRQVVLLGFPPATPGRVGSGAPTLALTRSVLVSDKLFSLLGALAAVAAFYFLAALALRKDAKFAAFNPIYPTSGQFGKASLSQFQIFAFTLLVVGLLVFILLRTGALSDISQDVLMLLGISAVGAGGSKLAAVSKRRLTLENWTWLRERGWLTAYEKGTGQKAEPKKARWGDLLKSGDDFDIYKFQLVTVSAVVALALLTGDQSQLATFSIPPNLLALLGLSNVVYIGAKAVTPNSFGELNDKVAAAHAAEKAMLSKVAVGGEAGEPGDSPEKRREDYLGAARDAAEMLRQVYGAEGTKFGSERISDGQLLPQPA